MYPEAQIKLQKQTKSSEFKNISETTAKQILESIKDKGYIYPQEEYFMHKTVINKYLRHIKKNDNLKKIILQHGVIWYLEDREREVFERFFPNLVGINYKKALEITKNTGVPLTKVNIVFALLKERRFLSLFDIMDALKCTKSMASLHTKYLEKINPIIKSKIIRNKKYIYFKDFESNLKSLEQKEFFDDVNLSNFLMNMRKFLGYCGKDFSLLLDIDPNTYFHYEKGRNPPPKDFIKRIDNVLTNINEHGKRKSLFDSRKQRVSDELLLFRGLRRYLGVTIVEFSKLIGNNNSNLNNVERGFISISKGYKEKILTFLKKIAKKKDISWSEALKGAEKYKKDVWAKWEIASKYDKIIDLRFPVGGGVEFEEKVANKLKSLNIFDDVLRNVVISDKDCKHKIEADIYAVKKIANGLFYDFVFECKSRKNWGIRASKGAAGFARELAFIKNYIDVKDVGMVIDRDISKQLEKDINGYGMPIIKMDDLGRYFNDRFMD